MNVKEMVGNVVLAWQAGKEPVMLRGAPGIGKSAGLLGASAILADHLGLKGGVLQWGDPIAMGLTAKDYFGYIDVRLSQCDPVDVGGLPKEDPVTGTQTRLPPAWFPHRDRADLPDYGIVALEEIVSAPQSVQAAAYQFTHDRRIGDKMMMDGWGVVLTGNRMTDGGQVFKMLTPLANRVTHLDVETDTTSWREWAIDHDIELSVIAFIGLRPELLNTFDKHIKEKLRGDAFATERTWEKVSKYAKTGATDSQLLALWTGCVSEGVAAEFFGFRQIWHAMPNIDAILLDPDNAPLPTDAAAQYAVAVALAARASKDTIDVILRYATRFHEEKNRPEIMVLCVKDTMRRDAGLYNTAAFIRWGTEYSSLLQ